MYNKRGALVALKGQPIPDAANVGPLDPTTFKKAMGPWDAPTSPYGSAWNAKFNMKIHMWVVDRVDTLQRLFKKTTYQAEGDAVKYVETDIDGMQGIWTSGTPFTSGSVESARTPADLENVYPAFLVDPWEDNWVSGIIASYKDEPKYDPAKNMKDHIEYFPFQIEKKLNQQIDTVNNDGSTYRYCESIDRLISSYAEAHTDYVNDAADPDLHYNNSTALVDRSGDSDDTFGGGAGDGIILGDGGATGARILDPGYIDDAMKGCKKYSKGKNYVLYMGESTLDELQYFYGDKERFIDGPMSIEYTVNGVKTRAGRDIGEQIASFRSRNVKMPIFTSDYAPGEQSNNISATVVNQDIGNIYLIDLDEIELRYALPTTHIATNDGAMLQPDNLTHRHMLATAFQLIATNPRAHGAVKYLKAM